jgi:hypothetical protein
MDMKPKTTGTVAAGTANELSVCLLHSDSPTRRSMVGDAFEVMPTMSADVALVDIFETYGNNGWERSKLERTCKGIRYLWAWGSASTG